MSAAVEIDFPRGNRRVENKEPNLKRKQEQLLPLEPERKKPKQKKVKQDDVGVDITQKPVEIQKAFTYNSVREGMIVLGSIKNITNLAITIELPNLVYVQVTLNCISEALTKRITKNLTEESDNTDLQSVLKNLFKIGQCVPCKILKIEETEKGRKLHGSINPSDVNSNILHYSLKKGVTIWANITTELDHGYELSAGIKNCRVFLPEKNIDPDRKFEIGEPIMCVVHKSESNNNVTTLTVSSKKEHLDKTQLNIIDNLNVLLPGTKVELLVEDILPNGIKGTFLNNFQGFIDKIHCFSQYNKIKVASTITAYVLYTETISTLTYLTLKDIHTLPELKHPLGKVMQCSITSQSPRGLFVKLGDDKGFITNKRLLNTISKIELNQADIKESIKKKYPVGSKHTCRILDYNQMEDYYICTVEPNVVKEKTYNVNDLKIGDKVLVTIQKKIANGIVVSVGSVQGFVPNIHVSNTQYTDNLKGKFTENTQVAARVLDITNDGNVLFTLKQEMVEADNCLCDINEYKPLNKYVGFVIKTKISGTLVGFYGNVKGWISSRRLNAELKCYNDPRNYFFRGQVVNVWCLGIKNDILQLSLNSIDPSELKTLKLGAKYSAKITGVLKEELAISVRSSRTIEASIPYSHLSRDPTLGKAFLGTYTVGDEIHNLLCMKNDVFPLLSRRESLVLATNKYKVLKFANVKKGMLLRANYESSTDEGINVSLFLADYSEKVFIPKKNLLMTKSQAMDFVPHQCILVKVLNIEDGKLTLSAKPDHVRLQDVEYALDLMMSNINDIDILRRSKINSGLKKHKIGSKVQGTVQSIDKNGCTILLSDDTKGFAPANLYNGYPKLNSTVEGVVLDHNFNEKFVYLSLRNNDKNRIKSLDMDSNIPFNTYCGTELLLITKWYAIGLLKGVGFNHRLVYLPVRYTESDNSIISLYNKQKFKVLLLREHKKKIIGVPKKLAILLAKQKPVKRKNSDTTLEPKTKKKRKEVEVKAEESEVTEIEDNKSDNEEEEEEEEDVEIKEEIESEDESNNFIKEVQPEQKEEIKPKVALSNLQPALSGVDVFYQNDEVKINEILSKKFEDTTEVKKPIKKKTEEEIAKIEKELADENLEPHSAEHFERLLLANPNSSELWLKYMAMLVSATELNKARAVGAKALETIDPTLTQEKFNVWNALLNLENIYGTKDSFEELFERAVKYNDSFEIYIKVINMLASSNKLVEMEEKVKKLRTKEKHNMKMWIELGRVYYTLQKFKEARSLQEAALKSIQDKKTQLQIILKFAIMEFQLGETQQAIAQFNTILDVHEKKVNIWTTYIDQLIKKKEIDLARQTLKRCVGLKFPIKSMRMLFQKFIAFEEQYGDAGSVESVKTQARDYVNSVTSK